MRKLFIAMIAGGFLLLSGVAASAKPDSGNGQQSQNGQQQTQTQNDQNEQAGVNESKTNANDAADGNSEN